MGSSRQDVRAVIFDFGGVITTSPFESFARYERENGLPEGLIVQLNSTNSDDNAWARLERNQVDLVGFAKLFEEEALAAGHRVDGQAVLAMLGGQLRPRMVEALRRCGELLKTALLTNNFVAMDDAQFARTELAEVVALFDVVVESSRVGLRKPDPAIYELVCEKLGVRPKEAVFLDDLGINLKPARAIGMHTIKVVDPDEALAELEDVVGFALG